MDPKQTEDESISLADENDLEEEEIYDLKLMKVDWSSFLGESD